MYLAFLKLNRWEGRQEGRGAPTSPYYWHAPSLWPLSVADCCTQGPTDGQARGGKCGGTTVCVTQMWLQPCVQHWGAPCVEHGQFGRDPLFEKVTLVSRRPHQSGFCWLRSAFMLMSPPLTEKSMSDAELPQSVWRAETSMNSITVLYSRVN